MSTHTPGPWIVERVPIQSRGGSNTCFRIGPFHACIYDDWRQREAGVTEEQNLANARLIAAAPDLLAALKDCADAMENQLAADCPFCDGEGGWQDGKRAPARMTPLRHKEGCPYTAALSAMRKAEGQD